MDRRTAARMFSNITLSVEVKLDEAEVRALDALVGYGFDSFIKVFYEKLGEHYMKPHENGLKSLFDTIGAEVRPHLHTIDLARKLLTEDLEGGKK